MVDVDDSSAAVSCPVVEMSEQRNRRKPTRIYRVSWSVVQFRAISDAATGAYQEARHERFFNNRELADQFVQSLHDAAAQLETSVSPFITEIEVREE